MKDKVSVVIVNYNGKRYLGDCLNSLLNMEEDGISVEIIMVDNLSKDESINFVKERFPEVRVIENNVNNFVNALNLCIKESKSDYIAFLNNDTKVDREWLKGLLEGIKSE